MDGVSARDRTSLWRLPAMRALAATTTLGFVGYFLTLAALPVYAVRGGADEDTAGVVTTVFLAVTVAVQFVVPTLRQRFGTGPVLVAGLLALGAPSPLYAYGNGLGWLSWISAVRGSGFAVLTVLGSLLATQVAPPERRGESVGLYGLAIAIPNLAAIPAGVALVLHGQAGWLAWVSACPVLAVPLVPALVRGGQPPAAPVRGAGRAALRAAFAPSLVLMVVTLAGGGLVTFLPIERPHGALATVALLLFGVTGAFARWRAGVVADRVGSRRLFPASVVLSVAGLGAVAAGLVAGDALVLLGAAVFGLGFGAGQNLSLLLAFGRAGSAGATAASALWNASFDAGTALGALVVGVVAADVGLSWTYVAVCGLLALSLPVAGRSTRVAAVAQPTTRSAAARSERR